MFTGSVITGICSMQNPKHNLYSELELPISLRLTGRSVGYAN